MIKEHFSSEEIQFVDYGTDSLESVDYPDFGKKTAEGVMNGEVERAIVICGTGIGISIAANKVKGIRAALCGDTFSAWMSREHNDANILALGARVIGVGLAFEIVDTYLNSKFEGGRHALRVEKLNEI